MEVCGQPSCMCSISNPFVFVGLGFLIIGIGRFQEHPWVSMYFNRNYVFKHSLWLSHVLFHSTFRKETLVGVSNVLYAWLKQENLPFYMTKEAGMSSINFPVILSNAILSPQAELAHGRVCMLATLGCILRVLHVFDVCVCVLHHFPNSRCFDIITPDIFCNEFVSQEKGVLSQKTWSQHNSTIRVSEMKPTNSPPKNEVNITQLSEMRTTN